MSERPPDGNLYAFPRVLPLAELLEPLARSTHAVVERIVSTGQTTERGAWLADARDEWVALLQGEAELAYEDGSRVVLRPGDHVLIPAGARHRVERTSVEPPAVWLAVYGEGLTRAEGPA